MGTRATILSRPELKRFCCSTIAHLPSWIPGSSAEVNFVLEMEIGPRSAEARSRFYVTVMTPAALADGARSGAFLLGNRALLVVSEFEWDAILEHIQKIIKSCDASRWDASVEKLVRYFRWEHETSSGEGET